MKLTYKPYIRDSLFDDFHIENPVLDITGYRPKYTQDLVEIEEVQPVKSDIKEIEEISSKKSNKEFRDREEFKDTMTSLYKDLLYKKGINPLFAKALVAQDGLESAWGSKPSGKFNFGGIKGKGTVKRTREVINGKDVYINDSFRDFDSLEDYANFKINLLNNRYHAFSGDISEFADRVHKGGYATDPNYSRVLNSIITSIKNGGIIKAQQGGVLQGKEWVKNWYKNRRSQIKSNLQRNRWFSVPVTGTLGYNILSKNMDLTSASVDPSKVPSGAKGVYYPRGRRIYLRDDSPSTAIHEWVHGSNPEPQVREIERIKGILGKTFYDQELTVPDDYLDNPQEIYSRLMQLRYALGVSPDHVFTNEEIEDLKRQHIVKEALINKLKSKDGNIEGTSTTIFDKHGNVIETEPLDPNYKLVPEESKSYRMYDNNETFNILDRYSTDGIRRLLNEVAQIPKKEPAINYVKLGFKVPKYQEPSGPIKNSSGPWRVWNDYSNQRPVDPNWRAPMLTKDTNLNNETNFEQEAVQSFNNLNRYWLNQGGSNLNKIDFVEGYNILREFGFSRDYTNAILANWFQESKFQPNIENSSSAKYIPQFLNAKRREDYEKYMKDHNLSDGIATSAKYLVYKYNLEKQYRDKLKLYNNQYSQIKSRFADIVGDDSYEYYSAGLGNYKKEKLEEFRKWLVDNNLQDFRLNSIKDIPRDITTFPTNFSLGINTYPTGISSVKHFHDWFERSDDLTMDNRNNYWNILMYNK